ncbi:zinc finger protein 512 isoform 2 [Mus musculus]|uniref:Zinc finger protein 512 n=1 Tax=Mus musculus TaxID=10090 RepID=A0A0J9YTU9_MOUSE|nr:zinc finger protein 512 isoform 2 [Mus musculus]
MSSRLGAVTATPGPTSLKQQRSTRIVGAKNNRAQCSIKDNSFQYTIPHEDSLSGSSSASSCEPVSDFTATLRKSTYWMKMRRIKPAATSQVEGAGEKEKERAKGKRNVKQEEDEDYRELPQKKHKLYGRKQRPKAQPHPKPQARRVRKEPPVYAAGSMEEKWYLEIMDKGSVSCPTCQAVGRKTIEGLKKHMENCKQEMFTCHHCGKQLHSLAGMKYHVMANHNSLPILKAGDEVDEPSERERLRTVLKRMGKLRCMREVFFPESEQPDCLKEMSLEAKGGGRVQRRSAKIAVYHLQELASAELTKEWPKRKVLQDLVPDDRKLKYTRPGLPTFSQEVLHKWKTDIKKYHRIQCPNQGCEAVYSSVSGLKAHLGSCTLGTFVAGKYKCLLCEKEFVSESGVKYHINSVHAEDWFVVNPTTTKSFEKLMKIKQRQQEEEKQRQQHGRRRSLRRQQQPCMEPPESQLEPKAGKEQGGNEELVGPDPEPVPAQPQKAEPAKTTHKRGRK